MRGRCSVMMLAAGLAGLAGMPPATARAEDRAWLEPVTGFFTDSSRWAGGLVPGAGTAAIFDHPDDEPEFPWYTVIVNSQQTIGRVLVGEARLDLDLAAGALNLTGPLQVAVDTVGALVIRGGQLNSIGGAIGGGELGFGNIMLSYASAWDAGAGQLVVGEYGSASLSVGTSATLTSGPTAIAAQPGSVGSITVTAGAWNSSGLTRIGGAGMGSLQLYQGAIVNTAEAELGGTGGFGSGVLINDSEWINAGALGVGTLAGASGMLRVDLGSRVVSRSMAVGGPADGRPTSGLFIIGGTVQVQQDLAIGQTGSLDMQSGIVSAHELQVLGQVRMVGQSVLEVDSLNIASGGSIDISGGGMVIRSDPSTRQAVHDQLFPLIQAGRADGAWNGTGIRSFWSGQDSLYGLALVINDRGDGTPLLAALHGLGLGPDDVLVVHALVGDVDLSGSIDGDDYYRMDQGFLAAGSGYQQGDLNYDGVIDAADFHLLDQAFLRLLPAAAPAAAVGASQVPEPGILLLLPLAMSLLRRRR
jgi:T5SS/PEP-CTERM-associated repeat protein